MTAPPAVPDRATPIPTWFAWLALFYALCLIAGLVIVNSALDNGLTNDIGFSVYHIPIYLCLSSLAALTLFLVVRAVREGRRWTQAFPAGYGSLGAGLLALVAYLLVDVGWREGVGIESSGIETAIAPSRILLFVGVLLVLAAPLRATLRIGAGVNRWPAIISAALLVALVGIGGFHPVQNPWLEHAEVPLNSEIWVMNGDGSQQTRLITVDQARLTSIAATAPTAVTPADQTATVGDGYQSWNASWSPDGRWIAFTRVHAGAHSPDDDSAEIWVATADGNGSRPVAVGDSYKWLPHWSPDGVWIVYTDEPVGGPWATTVPPAEGLGGFLGPVFIPGKPTPIREPAQIWRVRADGTGAPEKITDTDANERAATYSPDGAKLAFDSRRDGTTHVYVMNADGSDPRRLTNEQDEWGATWSPDGRSIAYKSSSGPGPGATQIFVTAADGSWRRQVTSVTGEPTVPSWSPDGTRIAFNLEQDGKLSIWSIALDGTDLHNLTNDQAAASGLTFGGGAWGKDGRIVYNRGEDPPASTDPLIREGLGTAAMLLVAILVSLAAVVVRIGPPFGSFALILGISTVLIGGRNDEWRFVPAAVVGGLIVDLLVRYVPPDRKAKVAGAGLAAAVVLGAGATVVLTTRLGWSPTLLLGVALASAAVGWVLGGLVGRQPVELGHGLEA